MDGYSVKSLGSKFQVITSQTFPLNITFICNDLKYFRTVILLVPFSQLTAEKINKMQPLEVSLGEVARFSSRYRRCSTLHSEGLILRSASSLLYRFYLIKSQHCLCNFSRVTQQFVHVILKTSILIVNCAGVLRVTRVIFVQSWDKRRH